MFGWLRKSRGKGPGMQPMPAKRRSIAEVPLIELQSEESRTRDELAKHSRELNHLIEREDRLLDQGKAALDESQKRAIAAEIQDIRKAKARLENRFTFLTKKLETTCQLIAIKEDEAFYRENGMAHLFGETSIDEIQRVLEGSVDAAALHSEDQREGMEQMLRRTQEYDLTSLRPLASRRDDELEGILSELAPSQEPQSQSETITSGESDAAQSTSDTSPAELEQSDAKPATASDAPSIEEDDAAFEARLRELADEDEPAPPPPEPRKSELE